MTQWLSEAEPTALPPPGGHAEPAKPGLVCCNTPWQAAAPRDNCMEAVICMFDAGTYVMNSFVTAPSRLPPMRSRYCCSQPAASAPQLRQTAL